MASFFKRYAPPSRRAIYFARETALHAGATHIDSCHLLCGVLREKSSRADKLFQLSQRFAEETARVRSLTRFPQARNLPLAEDARRIFALTTEEANLQKNYWIDTDHLILGILCDESSAGATMLNRAGLNIGEARMVVSQAGRRRWHELWWWLEEPIPRVIRLALLGFVAALCLFALLADKGCSSLLLPRH